MVTSAAVKAATEPDRIADELRRAILTGKHRDGEVLSQVALARQFGVSRVPVREALRQLQAEELVRIEPHHRVTVSGLTPDLMREIATIRALLEPHLLTEAFPHLDDGLVARLEATLDEIDATDDRRRWLEGNRAFHLMLYERSGSPIAMGLVEQLSARSERYLYLWSQGRQVVRADEAQSEHRALVAAVRRQDLGEALATLVRHIAGTRDRVEEMFAGHLKEEIHGAR